MGQQQSKKSKKSAKEKDQDPPQDGLFDDPPGSHSPRATLRPIPSQSAAHEYDAVRSAAASVDIPDRSTTPVGSSAQPPASPAIPPSTLSTSPNNLSSSSLPSPPLTSSTPAPPTKPSPTPLDIPSTQTILSTSTMPPSFTPGSTTSSFPLNDSLSSSGNGGKEKLKQFDIDDMIQRLLDVGYTGKVSKSLCLKNTEITAVCQAAREVFLSQPTLIELSPPVKIVGDVHGQYSDLIRLFEMCGFPPSANYLFLGDYVDRGKQSLETILLLLCYKIKYPENFFLLRGNHECANVTRGLSLADTIVPSAHSTTVYGFYDECKRRCNIKTWRTFIDVFNCLPIAAVVASKIFCVHGGLSPSLHSMDDIKRIQRPTDVPDYGLLNDLLWSDPSDTALDWEDNERGVSYCFGKSVINDFLVRYDMDLICRAHMVVEDGYEFWNDRTLVTVFSAPNYCGGLLVSFFMEGDLAHSSTSEFDNYGACMRFALFIHGGPPSLRSLLQRVRRFALCVRAAQAARWSCTTERDDQGQTQEVRDVP